MIEKYQRAYARRVSLGENLAVRMLAAKIAAVKLQAVERLHFLKWILELEKIEAHEVERAGIYSCSNFECVGIPVAFAGANGFCETCAESRNIPIYEPKRRWSAKNKRTHADLVSEYGSSDPAPIQLPFWQSARDWDTDDGKQPF